MKPDKSQPAVTAGSVTASAPCVVAIYIRCIVQFRCAIVDIFTVSVSFGVCVYGAGGPTRHLRHAAALYGYMTPAKFMACDSIMHPNTVKS